MTDLERIEEAVRRTAARCTGGALAYWFNQLADELLRIQLEKDPDDDTD